MLRCSGRRTRPLSCSTSPACLTPWPRRRCVTSPLHISTPAHAPRRATSTSRSVCAPPTLDASPPARTNMPGLVCCDSGCCCVGGRRGRSASPCWSTSSRTRCASRASRPWVRPHRLPLDCRAPVFPLHFAVFPLPFHCLSRVFALLFACLFSAFRLSLHCLLFILALPFACLCTAFC